MILRNLFYAFFFGAINATPENRLPAAGLPASAEKSAIGKFSVSARDRFENLISLMNPKNDPQGLTESPQGPPRKRPGTISNPPEYP